MREELVYGKELRDRMDEGIDKLTQAVLCTMGPHGRTVGIHGVNGYYITKDGVSVARALDELEDPVQNIAVTLIKEVAENTVRLAGDGTTTATCLAAAFTKLGLLYFDEGYTYNEIKLALEDLLEKVQKELTQVTLPLRRHKLKHIALISANNDETIANLIDEAYMHSKIVKVEESNDKQDELTFVSGIELDTTYVSKAFITNASKQTVEYGNSYVLLVGGYLDKLDDIAPVLQRLTDKPIVIIAEHFSESVLSILKENFNRSKIEVVPIKTPGVGGFRKDLLEDISIYTNAEILKPHTKYRGLEVVGQVDSVKVSNQSTILLNDKTEVAVNDRLSELHEAKGQKMEDYSRELLEKRIEILSAKSALIRVGGTSELERKERKDRIDDAVLAVACALDSGIVEGGGVALYKIADVIEDNLFSTCLKAPALQITRNGAEYDMLGDMFSKDIIDPAKVTQTALENAVSVSKTLLSMETMIL